MGNGDETTIRTEDQNRVLLEAEQQLFDGKDAANRKFRKALLVASNAVQASRMFANLNELIEKMKEEGSPDVDALADQVAEARTLFNEAISSYDENCILTAEGRIEQLTLQYDRFYLEGEETRKREYLQNRKRHTQKVKWTENPSSRFLSLLKGDLEGVEKVTDDERRSCVSRCAWGFAVLGLIIAISFLIVEYWSAQMNPAIVTSLQRNDELTIPVIFGCSSFPLVPTFENLPNDEYKGSALWGMRSYTNLETGETLVYPKTKLLTEETYLGRRDYCSTAMQYLSVEAIQNAFASESIPNQTCFSCLKLGVKAPFRLSRKAAQSRARGALTLEFALSRDIEFCFDSYASMDTNLRDSIRKTVKVHADALVSRGILRLNNTDDPAYALDFGFEFYAQQNQDDKRAAQTAESSVLCNLYLFSGFFFPVKPGTAIRYHFDADATEDPWQPIGNPAHFLVVGRGVRPFDRDMTASRADFFAEVRAASDKWDFLSTSGYVTLYTVDESTVRPNAMTDHAATLRENRDDVLVFTRRVENGRQRHESVLETGAKRVMDVMGRFRRFNVSLDFRTFDTEIVTRRPTTSTAEFLTDIFEYVGLFTGICAYSVLVGPARMYLKRGRGGHGK